MVALLEPDLIQCYAAYRILQYKQAPQEKFLKVIIIGLKFYPHFHAESASLEQCEFIQQRYFIRERKNRW